MNDERRNDSLPIGLVVAAIGAVLLIVSLFLDWYEPGISGFTVFEFLDLLLVLLALATIASLAGDLGLVRAAPSPVVSFAVAVFAVLVVASQILNDPPAVAFSDDIGKEIGIWLALAGSGLMVAGAVLGFARISLAVEARPRGAGEDPHPTRPLGDPDTPGGEGERERR